MKMKTMALALAAVCPLAIATPAIAGSIVVEKAWATEYEKGGEGRGDVFVVVKNSGSSDDVLYAAKTRFAKRLKLEAKSEEEVDAGESETIVRLDVPAGQTLEMGEDGAHIELHGARGEFEVGETFKMTLYFENAGPVFTTVTIEEEDE